MTEADRWKQFWGKQTTPLHRFNTPFWYEKYAEEINLILKVSEYSGGAVLETGCGNGALFPYLDINKKEYTGVDISESLLSIFRSKHPDANLICGDSSTYLSNERFSLIFTNDASLYINFDGYVKREWDSVDSKYPMEECKKWVLFGRTDYKNPKIRKSLFKNHQILYLENY